METAEPMSLRSWKSLAQEALDDEGIPTATSKEQVNINLSGHRVEFLVLPAFGSNSGALN